MSVNTQHIYTVIISAVVMLGLDGIFLTTAGEVFSSVVKKIQHKPLKLNPVGALLAYLGMIIVLNMFILLQPKIPENKKYILAFFLGFCIYLIYEGTNYAIFADWNLKAVVTDTIWGSLLFLITTFITVKIMKSKLFVKK